MTKYIFKKEDFISQPFTIEQIFAISPESEEAARLEGTERYESTDWTDINAEQLYEGDIVKVAVREPGIKVDLNNPEDTNTVEAKIFWDMGNSSWAYRITKTHGRMQEGWTMGPINDFECLLIKR